jgi:predicted ATPase
LSDQPHLALSHFCSPYGTNSALHPIIAQLERAAGFAADDTPEAKLAKLAALLGQATGQLDEALPLLASLLGIPSGGRFPVPNLSPQRQKQRTLEVLIEQLAGLARTRPVLELYEDLHWVDPSTLELLDQLVERVRNLPVLAVLTYRPEFSPPWSGHAHVTSLPLNRLGRRQGAAMVERVVGGKGLPAEVLEQIVARTDGVPLFVEELTKTVLESGLLTDTGDRYELTAPLPPLAIPATLQDSLMARLDRLAPVKEVAQTAAVIGREFSHELIAAVSPLAGAHLDDALNQLIASELIFRRGTPPEATYSFKHALVQDAAYQSLLKSRRQHLHARIAEVLEERFPEQAEAEPEVLGHHCTEAGLFERAVTCWHNAGQLAVRRSAMSEAIAQLQRGIELLPLLPEDRGRVLQELDLQVTLGLALLALKGVAAPQMGEAYARARELCRKVGETSQLFPALYGLFSFHLNRAELNAARDVAEELLRWARARKDTVAAVVAHRCAGTGRLFRGELMAATEDFERVLALYAPAQRYSEVLHDPRVLATSQTAWTVLLRGYLDQGLVHSREALAAAQASADAHTLATTMHQQNVVDQLRRDWQSVGDRAASLVALTDERGFAHWHATGTILRGWAVAAGGSIDDGIDAMRRGLAAKRATGAQLKVPYYLGLLASACASRNQHAEARALLDDALARVGRTGECWFEAELHRCRAEISLRSPEADPTGAEICLRKALAVAQEQEAKLWELRAATSLARLWGERGERQKAHDLLAPVYDWFTEGFDTADLKDAKALLDELR